MALVAAALLLVAAVASVSIVWEAIATGCIATRRGVYCRADQPGLFTYSLVVTAIGIVVAGGVAAVALMVALPRRR